MEVSACRGSDEGRRLANLFQQVAVDCKVILLSMEWFSMFGQIKIFSLPGASTVGDGADGSGWQVG